MDSTRADDRWIQIARMPAAQVMSGEMGARVTPTVHGWGTGSEHILHPALKASTQDPSLRVPPAGIPFLLQVPGVTENVSSHLAGQKGHRGGWRGGGGGTRQEISRWAAMATRHTETSKQTRGPADREEAGGHPASPGGHTPAVPLPAAAAPPPPQPPPLPGHDPG